MFLFLRHVPLVAPLEVRQWFMEPPHTPAASVSQERMDDALIYLKDAALNQLLEHHPRDAGERKAYNWLHSRLFHGLDLAVALIYMALAVFERPAFYAVPVAATASIEASCLVRLGE